MGIEHIFFRVSMIGWWFQTCCILDPTWDDFNGSHWWCVPLRGFRVAESPCSRGDPQRIRIDESGTMYHHAWLMLTLWHPWKRWFILVLLRLGLTEGCAKACKSFITDTVGDDPIPIPLFCMSCLKVWERRNPPYKAMSGDTESSSPVETGNLFDAPLVCWWYPHTYTILFKHMYIYIYTWL